MPCPLLVNRLDIVGGAVPAPTHLAIVGVAVLSFYSQGFLLRTWTHKTKRPRRELGWRGQSRRCASYEKRTVKV